ncbi:MULTISPECIES: AAA domain-containing protein [unclassified Amycolatopsis]|uniref:caspase, EACC1-associated type n=1 Tax=Amycolatopsis sp. CFH S0078 TaxID=1644108 RepID=UPI00106ED801|nr:MULTISPECIES: AAA domain-containing protein [unclassified Amycolatopsis]
MSGGRKRALLIGTAGYRDTAGFSALPCTHSDVAELRQVLEDPAIGQFAEVQAVLDPDAAMMRDRIAAFLGDLEVDDLGLLYISGHGHRLSGSTSEFHFIAADSRKASCEQTAVGASFVNEHLENSYAAQKVAIFDCCYSGGFSLGMTTRLAKGSAHRNGFPQPRGVYVMASSGPSELSWVDSRPRSGPTLSLFTAELVTALRTGKADTDGDGIVSANELFHYVNDQVRAVQPPEQAERQVPVFSADRVNGQIHLARCQAGQAIRPVAQSAVQPTAGQPSGKGTAASAFGAPTPAALLRYYQACVRKDDAEPKRLLDAHAQRQYACFQGAERLLVRDLDSDGAVPMPAEAAQLVDSADEHTELWYGYPAVVLHQGRGRPQFAPLFLTQVEVVDSAGGRRLRPVGEVVPHDGLVNALLDNDEAAALLSSYQSTWQSGMHSHLLREVQHFLREDFGLATVQPLRPNSLEPEIETDTPTSGARNAAVLFAHQAGGSASNGLIKDLDYIADHEGEIRKTALAPLFGLPGNAAVRPWRPVYLEQCNDGQRAVLESAMTQQLTVATGPPGTGKSQLVANAVATALVNGQSVLVASTNNRAVDEVWERCEKLVPGAVVRTGNQQMKEREKRTLTDYLAMPPPRQHSATAVAELDRVFTAHTEAVRALAATAEQEARLLALGQHRKALAEQLSSTTAALATAFSATDLAALHRRASRAANAKFFGARRRAKFCASVGWHGETTAEVCQRLATWAWAELQWQQERARPTPSDDQLAANLAQAENQVLAASRAALETVVRTSAHTGKAEIETLLRASSTGGWAAMRRCREHVKGWALTALSARRLPADAASFDLVIVDEASQCSVPHLIPLLYRGARALVIGDVQQLGPVIKLSEQAEAELVKAHRVSPVWLDSRQLSYRRHSAFHAVERLVRAPLLLDEHYRCHPEIADLANRRFYRSQLTVLTDEARRTQLPGAPISWIDVAGAATRSTTTSWQNDVEARRVAEVVERLLAELPESATIGVITPYKGQAGVLGRRLAHDPRVVTGTVHTFQGGERDVIVLSPVVSRDFPAQSKRWLQQQDTLWNVAVTRARSRLIVVGDRSVWSEDDNIGAALVRAAERSGSTEHRANADSLLSALYAWLRHRCQGQVELLAYRNGYLADAVSGEHTFLLDRGPVDERPRHQHLRVQLLRTRLLNTSSSTTTRVPAWRLFDNA